MKFNFKLNKMKFEYIKLYIIYKIIKLYINT